MTVHVRADVDSFRQVAKARGLRQSRNERDAQNSGTNWISLYTVREVFERIQFYKLFRCP